MCLDMAGRSADMPTLLNILGTCIKCATTMKGWVPKPDLAGSTTEVPIPHLGRESVVSSGYTKKPG